MMSGRCDGPRITFEIAGTSQRFNGGGNFSFRNQNVDIGYKALGRINVNTGNKVSDAFEEDGFNARVFQEFGDLFGFG